MNAQIGRDAGNDASAPLAAGLTTRRAEPASTSVTPPRWMYETGYNVEVDEYHTYFVSKGTQWLRTQPNQGRSWSDMEPRRNA